MKIIGIGVSMLAINTWGTRMFDLDKLQDFLKDGNIVDTHLNTSAVTLTREWFVTNETVTYIESAHNMSWI